ncbi:MAG: hypothetical protein ACR2KQ_10265 [Actinomycetota bacterium]
MFVQIIHGEVKERQGLEAEQQRWQQELMPGAEGFLGMTGGGDDDAAFVQVMLGRVKDVDTFRALNERMEEEFPTQRPDILGGLNVTYDDGHFTDVVYFRSLEEARRAEKVMEQDPPPEMQEWATLLEGDLTYFDLEEPWLVSPR